MQVQLQHQVWETLESVEAKPKATVQKKMINTRKCEQTHNILNRCSIPEVISRQFEDRVGDDAMGNKPLFTNGLIEISV